MKIKIAGTLTADAADSLDGLAAALYATPGMRVVCVAELAHTERTQIAPDEKKVPSVTLGVKFLEVARSPETAEALRKALRALKLQRSAEGTLDEELGTVDLSRSTIEMCGDSLAMAEAARLRVVLKLALDDAATMRSATYVEADMRAALDAHYRLLDDALSWEQVE